MSVLYILPRVGKCLGRCNRLIESNRSTTLDYDSESRPITSLEKILGGHPNFPFFKKIYEKGMDYEFIREISEEERSSEVQANIERGNHKSAEASPEVV